MVITDAQILSRAPLLEGTRENPGHVDRASQLSMTGTGPSFPCGPNDRTRTVWKDSMAPNARPMIADEQLLDRIAFELV